MKAVKRIAITLVAVIGLLFGGYVALIYYINLPSGVILAEELNIANEWTEIDIKPAIRAEYRSQSIALTIENIDLGPKLDGMIHLNDGTVIDPEVELIDEGGLVQRLTLSGFTEKYGVAANYRTAKGTHGFAENRKFVKLRIRSERPFSAVKIVWKDYNPK